MVQDVLQKTKNLHLINLQISIGVLLVSSFPVIDLYKVGYIDICLLEIDLRDQSVSKQIHICNNTLNYN